MRCFKISITMLMVVLLSLIALSCGNGETLSEKRTEIEEEVDVEETPQESEIEGEEAEEERAEQPSDVETDNVESDLRGGLVGEYINKGDSEEGLILYDDNTFLLYEDYTGYSGTWSVENDTITLITEGRWAQAKIVGNTLLDEEGKVWVKAD